MDGLKQYRDETLVVSFDATPDDMELQTMMLLARVMFRLRNCPGPHNDELDRKAGGRIARWFADRYAYPEDM